MLKAYFKDSTYFLQLILILFVSLSGFLLFLVIAYVFSMLLFDVSHSDIISIFTDVSNKENINLLKFFQIIQSLGLFVFSPLLIAYLLSDSVKRYLRLTINPGMEQLLLAVLFVIFSLPLINFLAHANSQMHFPDSM
ncbi:hypothetical protein ACFLSA_02230, partial [Bacteroidota bacterium]